MLLLLFPPFVGLLQARGPPWGEPVAYLYLYGIVSKFVMSLLSPSDWHAYAGSLLDRCLFVVLLYALPATGLVDRWRARCP
jgi:hypothetical protein